jgi:HSP20 family protein
MGLVLFKEQTMAQPQRAQTRNGGSRAATLPATQTRAGLPAMRGMTAWSSPFGLMRRLSEDMDQLFTQLVAAPTGRATGPLATAPVDWMPALETFERDGKLVLQADLPGLGVDDVTIEIDDGVLTLSGERRIEREFDDNGTRRTERQYGRFMRSIGLPEGVRAEDVQASFHDGVLEITVPLPQASQQQRRKVEIQRTSQDSTPASGKTSARTSQDSPQASEKTSA